MFVPTSFVLKFHTIFTQKGRDEKVGSGHWNQTYFLFRFSQVHFHYDHRRYCNCNVLIIVSIATHKHDFPYIIMLNTLNQLLFACYILSSSLFQLLCTSELNFTSYFANSISIETYFRSSFIINK